jgi:hypothetical protein
MAIQVNDLVEIVSAGPSEQQLLHRVGRVVLITDGTKCVVAFNDGSGASVKVEQLRKVG